MEGRWEGKEVEIIFDDGSGVSKKVGIIIGEDSNFLYFRDPSNREQAINKTRVIRISEVRKNGGTG